MCWGPTRQQTLVRSRGEHTHTAPNRKESSGLGSNLGAQSLSRGGGHTLAREAQGGEWGLRVPETKCNDFGQIWASSRKVERFRPSRECFQQILNHFDQSCWGGAEQIWVGFGAKFRRLRGGAVQPKRMCCGSAAFVSGRIVLLCTTTHQPYRLHDRSDLALLTCRPCRSPAAQSATLAICCQKLASFGRV